MKGRVIAGIGLATIAAATLIGVAILTGSILEGLVSAVLVFFIGLALTIRIAGVIR